MSAPQVSVDPDLCQSCGKCPNTCPVKIFHLSTGGRAFPAFASDCHVCR